MKASIKNTLDRRFCVAPLLDLTTQHQRYFMRILSKHAVLYTEMITTGALIYGDRDRYLQYNEAEHPVAIQLGGSDPKDMAQCAKMAEDYGYDEININLGCPSERVQKGAFGACLMLEPELIAECIGEMQVAASKTPITVKNRIGVDDHDSYDKLTRFVDIIASAGCETFIIHARKALLKGLSPKQNREIPPLSYPTVYQLKKDFPQLEFILNGGIKTLQEAEEHQQHVDGVMLGREAYHNPFLLVEVDQQLYQDNQPLLDRKQIIELLIEYTEQQLSKGVPLNHMTRHILGLFHAQSGAKAWRRHLSENATKKGAGIEVLQEAKEIQHEHQKAIDLKNSKR
ncbi:MAG: tRNA dihydrouridine(20/20a) synthase DusA [Thiotrichaceae bacterium]